MQVHRLSVVAILGLLVGCSAHIRPAAPQPPPPALPVQQFTGINAPSVTLVPDPVTALITRVEANFSAGQTELALGHRAAARERFDAAIDELTAAPGGARTSPRLAAEFESLLDRISAIDVVELRAGDGFSESRSEPAAIDELLEVATFERPAEPTKTTGEVVTADLAKTPHDVTIPVNDKVLSYVELFQGNLRSFMEDGLARGARYLPMIEKVFKSEGLPLDLAFVPLVESAFKPTALSRASAKGLWQFESDTAKDEGLEQNWFLDERSDPEKATRAAAQYLKMLRDMFDGDWNLALASYNAGMGRIQRAVRQSHDSDYWQLSASSRYLPRETREYVPMILAAVLIGRNPEQYGFEVTHIDPLSYELVTVPDALNLGVVAEWLGISVEDIQALNPELRRGMTPLGNHELKVPVGTADIVRTKLESASPAVFASATFRWYTVKKGDTLASVARKYKTTTARLAAANDLKPTSRVRGGTTLMVPIAPAAALATHSTPPQATAQATSARTRSTYQVKAGDTLYGIARQFDLSVDDLKRMNQLTGDTIVPGDKLNVHR
jgi:membrane-bound lytic murein transglycosylase D